MVLNWVISTTKQVLYHLTVCKQTSSGSFKNVTNKIVVYYLYI